MLRLYPSTHDTSSRPPPKPQRGSNSAPLSAPRTLLPLPSPCPLALPWTMLVCRLAGTEACLDRNGGNEGLREGKRDRRKKICRRRGGWRVILGKKKKRSKGLTLIFSVLPPLLFHSCTFLSIQHYMRGPSQSVLIGRREVDLEGLHPH